MRADLLDSYTDLWGSNTKNKSFNDFQHQINLALLLKSEKNITHDIFCNDTNFIEAAKLYKGISVTNGLSQLLLYSTIVLGSGNKYSSLLMSIIEDQIFHRLKSRDCSTKDLLDPLNGIAIPLRMLIYCSSSSSKALTELYNAQLTNIIHEGIPSQTLGFQNGTSSQYYDFSLAHGLFGLFPYLSDCISKYHSTVALKIGEGIINLYTSKIRETPSSFVLQAVLPPLTKTEEDAESYSGAWCYGSLGMISCASMIGFNFENLEKELLSRPVQLTKHFAGFCHGPAGTLTLQYDLKYITEKEFLKQKAVILDQLYEDELVQTSNSFPYSGDEWAVLALSNCRKLPLFRIALQLYEEVRR